MSTFHRLLGAVLKVDAADPRPSRSQPLKQIFMGMKRLVFHPMLYAALLFHWLLLRTPLPATPPVVEEPEEPESVQIAKSIPLESLTTQKPPKPNLNQRKTPPKPKPGIPLPKNRPAPPPVATTSQPPAKEKPTQTASPEPTRPVDNATPPSSPPTESEPEVDPNARVVDEKDLQAYSEPEVDPNARVVDEKDLQAYADLAKQFGASAEEQAVGFDTSLLPQPELIFTSESLQAYANQTGALQYQDPAFNASWWKNSPKEEAYEKLQELYPDGIQRLGDYASGDLFEAKKGEKVYYASLIYPPKRTQRSSTVFVIWARNPLASQ